MEWCVLTYILLIILLQNVSLQKTWTESDEKRRIEQINAEELLAYDMEMKSQVMNNIETKATKRYDTSTHVNPNDANPIVDSSIPKDTIQQSPDDDNWCYRCASPLKVLRKDLRRAIQSFLSLRRTAYPYDAIREDCVEPRNVTAFSKDYCRHSYCQTLILTDHESATAFTMRGCAETFGAVNEDLLANQENSCKRLHERLDLRECICSNRKYCYAGTERALFRNSSRSYDLSVFILLITVCNFICPFFVTLIYGTFIK